MMFYVMKAGDKEDRPWSFEFWLGRDEFILYGVGEKVAIPIFDDLNKAVKIKMIIDNNKLKQGERR